MRIVETCTSHDLGGLELYFVTCCKNLKRRGHNVIAVVDPESKLYNLLRKEFECIQVHSDFRQLKPFLESWNPDIIHIHHKKDLSTGCIIKKIIEVGI